MSYKVYLSPPAAKELEKLPPQVCDRIEPAIMSLGDVPRPHGVRKIQGSKQAYRIRMGRYRIVYEIYDDNKLVLILGVSRRTERTYKRI